MEDKVVQLNKLLNNLEKIVGVDKSGCGPILQKIDSLVTDISNSNVMNSDVSGIVKRFEDLKKKYSL